MIMKNFGNCVIKNMETHIGIGIGKIIEEKCLNARNEILISSPMISPIFAKKMVFLLKKGIKIKIITSEPYHEEEKQAIKILQENSLKKENNGLELKVVDYKQAALIHAKIYIIDNKSAITGSPNFTEKSFFKLPEYIIVQSNDNEINQIRKDFECIWKNFRDETSKNIAKKRIKNMAKKLLFRT